MWCKASVKGLEWSVPALPSWAGRRVYQGTYPKRQSRAECSHLPQRKYLRPPAALRRLGGPAYNTTPPTLCGFRARVAETAASINSGHASESCEVERRASLKVRCTSGSRIPSTTEGAAITTRTLILVLRNDFVAAATACEQRFRRLKRIITLLYLDIGPKAADATYRVDNGLTPPRG